MLRTRHWERTIDGLDPVEDDQAIVLILFNHVFSLDLLLSTELGQLRTFSIPSISRILHATRRYERAGPRRLDDTKAILNDILQNGPESEAGGEMVEHLNAIHAHYAISNDDYRYTLSALFIDFGDWVKCYGWRPLRDREREAMVNFHNRVGCAMGITDLPQTWDAWEAWRTDYEATAQRAHPDNAAVTAGFVAAVGTWLPRPLRPLVAPTIAALMPGDACVAALMMKRPWWTPALRGIMAVRRVLGRWINPWQRIAFTQTALFSHYPTYPGGFQRLRLGPPELIARIHRTK